KSTQPNNKYTLSPTRRSSDLFKFKLDCKNATYFINNCNKTIKIDAPITLKITCVNAARRAATEAPMEANIAVIVVPKLSPNNTGMAACSEIACSAYNTCKITIVADEHCTNKVNTVPISTTRIGLSLILTVKS